MATVTRIQWGEIGRDGTGMPRLLGGETIREVAGAGSPATATSAAGGDHDLLLPRVAVYVLDRKEYLANADAFAGMDVDAGRLDLRYGDIFACADAECMVTAGNSFGMMDGGIDGAVNYHFDGIEAGVQAAIMEQWRGELPVGAAIVLDAPQVPGGVQRRFTHLCYAPTMRVPGNVASSINAYLAMRGALAACMQYNRGRGRSSDAIIRRLAVPMLCRGVGNMAAPCVLHQIRQAYESMRAPTPADWSAISEAVWKLMGDGAMM